MLIRIDYFYLTILLIDFEKLNIFSLSETKNKKNTQHFFLRLTN